MKKIFLFPGQGSQYVGMGKDIIDNFPIAKDTFAEADEAIHFHLKKICLDGPEADLKLTKYTQPAILTHSIAVYRVLQKETPLRADYVAGHSLGEYSALVASGVLNFTDAVLLVHKRGQFMQEAVPAGTGAMAALVGATQENAEKLCKAAARNTTKVCELANFNGGGQIVISGHKEGIQEAIKLLADPSYGIRKAVELPVSAPFHCSLMAPAEKNMKPLLDKTNFGNLQIPYIANVDAKVYGDNKKVKENLLQQISRSVLWEQSMLSLASLGVTQAYEIGPGKVLAGLLRRINKEISCTNIETAEDIKKF